MSHCSFAGSCSSRCRRRHRHRLPTTAAVSIICSYDRVLPCHFLPYSLSRRFDIGLRSSIRIFTCLLGVDRRIPCHQILSQAFPVVVDLCICLSCLVSRINPFVFVFVLLLYTSHALTSSPIFVLVVVDVSPFFFPPVLFFFRLFVTALV
ncbi:hypothetical protein BJV74DRAFT_400035 [Russula compacta]|nr:hypothetical protein BJV74DRAFT_400035 [Russula compacta]